MSTVIKLTNLTKKYGSSRGIQNINLEVEKGMIFGFLGPNGAGKTTTISILVDLLRPTSGTARIFGKDTCEHGLEVRRRIGYLAGDIELDGSLTGKQQLEYFGSLRGVYNETYVKELAEQLDCDLSKKIKTLSRGNKQKVGLISALMHKPDLLILDEPTSGLDPLIQEQFNSIIKKHKDAGKTTFISSHILSEVQELCDQVAFVKEGNLIANEPISTIAQNAPYMISIASKDKKLIAILKKLPEAHTSASSDGVYSFMYVGEITKLLQIISSYQINDLSITKGDLESTFMHFYKD